MIIKKLHTPEGVKDYLPSECILKTKIENNVSKVFKSFGYVPVKSPTFEYSDVFDNKGSVSDKNLYRFVDRDGSILTLRSDMTPAIARIVATTYSDKKMPIRLSYIENLFRHTVNYQGKLNEFTQAGVELIGAHSISADVEVLVMAIKAILSSGVKNFKIDLGHSDFLKGVLEETSLDDENIMMLQEFIADKNYVAVNDLVSQSDISGDLKYIFNELPFLIGDLSVLNSVREKNLNKKSLDAVDYLENIYNILKELGFEQYFSFDLGVLGSMDYYTGIIFRGYAEGVGFSIVDGGRYDKLVKNFGADYPAVGFAVKINDLMQVLKTENTESADILVVFDDESIVSGFKYAEALRNAGRTVEIGLSGKNLEENKAYAASKNINKIVAVNGKITEIDLDNNEEKTIDIESLLNKEAE